MDNIISKLTYVTKQRTTQTRHYLPSTGYATKTDSSIEEYAERLASLIEAFVKSGEVTVKAGISVSTAGTAAAQTGSTTSVGTGTIS